MTTPVVYRRKFIPCRGVPREPPSISSLPGLVGDNRFILSAGRHRKDLLVTTVMICLRSFDFSRWLCVRRRRVRNSRQSCKNRIAIASPKILGSLFHSNFSSVPLTFELLSYIPIALACRTSCWPIFKIMSLSWETKFLAAQGSGNVAQHKNEKEMK